MLLLELWLGKDTPTNLFGYTVGSYKIIQSLIAYYDFPRTNKNRIMMLKKKTRANYRS